MFPIWTGRLKNWWSFIKFFNLNEMKAEHTRAEGKMVEVRKTLRYRVLCKSVIKIYLK